MSDFIANYLKVFAAAREVVICSVFSFLASCGSQALNLDESQVSLVVTGAPQASQAALEIPDLGCRVTGPVASFVFVVGSFSALGEAYFVPFFDCNGAEVVVLRYSL